MLGDRDPPSEGPLQGFLQPWARGLQIRGGQGACLHPCRARLPCLFQEGCRDCSGVHGATAPLRSQFHGPPRLGLPL